MDHADRTTHDPEGDWIESHLDILSQHAGQWVAIGPDGIIASDPDILAVQELVRQKGAADPLFYQVPSEAEKSLPWAM